LFALKKASLGDLPKRKVCAIPPAFCGGKRTSWIERKKERRWLASKESRLDGYLGDTFKMHVNR
jgi:hypothetical protein